MALKQSLALDSLSQRLPECKRALPVLCCSAASPSHLHQVTMTGECSASQMPQRMVVRLAIPSRGRMADDTLSLLKDCQLSVHKPNPWQYAAKISSMPGLEVWFLPERDVIRKMRTGDVDLGIVGYDTVCEHGEGDDDLIVVHEALQFGECHLAMAVPINGLFGNVSSMVEVTAMWQWSVQRPLRILTSFPYLGKQFTEKLGLKHVQLLTAEGALEAAPAMGTADAILDLIGSGNTLRENNMKEIDGSVILRSQGVLVASKHALLHRQAALEHTREVLERLEANLRARSQFTVVAHMEAESIEEVADAISKGTNLHGLKGPTVNPVFATTNGTVQNDSYTITIRVSKGGLYDAVKQLEKIGAHEVLVSPLTYIFEKEAPRWRRLLDKLKLV